MRPTKHLLMTSLVLPLTLTLLPLAACATASAPPSQATDPTAERSFTEEELTDHDGSSYFPETFTFEELMEDYACTPGTLTDAGFTPGGYIVTPDGPLTPGMYYLEGSQTETGTYYIYIQDEEGKYYNKAPLSYFGFSLALFNENDLVIFLPPSDDDLMHPLGPEPLPLQAPYASGLYRVGVDIPAGTYLATQEPQSAEAIAEKFYLAPGVIVYDTLSYTEGSTAQAKDLQPLAEGAEEFEFSVTDGQYVELFGCTAQPKES